MISKIGIWILVKLAEGVASKYMTSRAGDAKRTKVVDYLIVRAEKAELTVTSADNDALRFWAGFLKSDRLKEALNK